MLASRYLRVRGEPGALSQAVGRFHTRLDRPAWLGREVSGEARYLNNNLAREPFSRWRD